MLRTLVAVLLLLTAVSLAPAVQYNYPAGTEIPELRTEKSKTYATGDGRFVAEIAPVPVHYKDFRGDWQELDENESTKCYPHIDNFWTGNIYHKNSDYNKNDDVLWIQGGLQPSKEKHQSWMKFDLTPIPDVMIVERATLGYFCYAVQTVATARISHVHADPTLIGTTAQILDDLIENGETFQVGGGHSPGVMTYRELNEAAEDTIQVRMTTLDWICLGLDCDDPNETNNAQAYGFNGGGAYIPRLEVVYSQPPFTDVKAVSVMSPTGNLPENTVATPIGRWANAGNIPADFDAYFKLIDPNGIVFYQEMVSITGLARSDDTVHVFANTPPLTPPGAWTARCSTRATNDIDPTNDTFSLSFNVTTIGADIDIAAEYIEEPTGVYAINEDILPEATWQNNSAVTASFDAFFTVINPGGERARDWTVHVANLAAGMDTTLIFAPPYNVGSVLGDWVTRCSTYAADDIDPDNDVLEDEFEVSLEGPVFDVAATTIASPIGWMDTNGIARPQAVWRNRYREPVDFAAFFMLELPSGTRVYESRIDVVGLEAGLDTTIDFPWYYVDDSTGRWTTRCSTYMAGDLDPSNDQLHGYFAVTAGLPEWSPGWKEMKSVPSAPSYKPVKHGAWLTSDRNTGQFYAAKGNKTQEFFRYDPIQDTWFELAKIPLTINEKLPNKGCKGVWGRDNRIYMTKGNNTQEFWSYDVATDTWHQRPDVPLGPTGKKVKGGNDLEYIEAGGFPYIYMLKGYKTEFYRFDILADSWQILRNAPWAPKGKWDRGSWLCFDGGQTIYAHQAKHHMFWKFDLMCDSWIIKDSLRGIPLYGLDYGKIKRKKSKDGASADWFDGQIYAIKGGNTQQFFRYTPSTDTWYEMETIPCYGSTAKKKKVKDGGDFTGMGNGAFFALKGGKTYEFWRYVLDLTAPPPGPMAGSAAPLNRLLIAPNPLVGRFATLRLGRPVSGAAVIKVYDALGRCVESRSFVIPRPQAALPLDLSRLASGVYLVKLRTVGNDLSEKLIIQR